MSEEMARTQGSYVQELKKLRGRHHRILRLHAAGMSNIDIAKALDVTPQTVSNTINSDLGQEKLQQLYQKQDEEMVDEVTNQIDGLAPIAFAELEDALINNTVEKMDRVQIAQDILDRAGYGKHKNVNVREEKVDDNDLKEIHARAKKKAREAGVVEDAKIIEEGDEEEDSE